MAKKICPQCRSRRLAKSRVKTIRDQMAKMIGNRYYRCLDCDWRGQVKKRPAVIKGVLGFILIAALMVWVAMSAYNLFQSYLEDYRANILRQAVGKPKPPPKPPRLP